MKGSEERAQIELLTEREREVVRLIAAGLSNLEIGERLHLPTETVKWYNKQLYAKLDVSSRAAAVCRARELGVLESDLVKESALRFGLPAPLTTFFGRERELEAVEQLLRKRRLVTLTGMGGTGKTRLALKVAGRVLPDFADGVAFVQLASMDDPDLVLEAIADSLDVQEQPGQTLLHTLRRFLADRRMLLFLDNFEHLLSGAPAVSELLAAAPQLTVLATSREPLRLYGEQEFQVGPLEVDVSGEEPSPAVQLFADRAQRARANFQLLPENITVVAQICILLDGLPLAIELAAAYSRVFSPPALLSRLEEATSYSSSSSAMWLLDGGPQDRPARQQTLRATIDWSYHLLTANEQALFRRLSVFAGGCTMEAIAAVCETDEEGRGDSSNFLYSLASKNLLRVEEGPDGEPRFSLLHVIREYARERLERLQEADQIRERHARYYCMVARQAGAELTGPHQALWLERLESEHNNLQAALRWAVHSGEVELGLRLASALWRFWLYHSHLQEGRRWLEELLALEAPAPGSLRATALYGLGELAHYQRDLATALDAHESSLALRRETGNVGTISDSLTMLGILLMELGAYERADALLEEGLTLARQLDSEPLIAYALSGLSISAMEQGRLTEAEVMLTETLLLMRAQKDQMGIWSALTNLGMVALYRGEIEHAQEHFQQSLAAVEPLNAPHFYATSRLNQGLVATRLGQFVRARALLQEALATFVELDEPLRIIQSLEGLAAVEVNQGRYEQGVTLWGATSELREALRAPLPPIERREQERGEAEVRANLGVVASKRAWAEGQRQAQDDFEGLIALALNDEAPPAPAEAVERRSERANLTARELDVLRLVAQGLSDKEAAKCLGISRRTINAHLTSIYRKLGVNSRTAASRVALDEGWL